jgi:hypothetical protein
MLSSAARSLQHFAGMPSYCDMILRLEWQPHIEGLALHMEKAVEAGRQDPRPYYTVVMNLDLWRAYQLAAAMLNDIAAKTRENPDVNHIYGTAVEDVREMLARSGVANVPTPARTGAAGAALPESGPDSPATGPDPWEATLELIPRFSAGQKLLRFLRGKPNRTATLPQISQHLYKERSDKRSLAKTRGVIDRIARALLEREAPLQVLRDKWTGMARVLPGNATWTTSG